MWMPYIIIYIFVFFVFFLYFFVFLYFFCIFLYFCNDSVELFDSPDIILRTWIIRGVYPP